MNSRTQLCKALCLALAGVIAYAGDTGAAPAKPKPKTAPKATAAKPDCILDLSCATLHPDSLGDTNTLRPAKDNLPIRAAKNPENFLTMKGVTLGLTYGECGDIGEPNKPVEGDTMVISPNADGTYNLTLTADGASTPKLTVPQLFAQPSRAAGSKVPIDYISGNYTGKNGDLYEFAVYLLDRKPYSTANFQKQYRLEVFATSCIAARPEQPGNIDHHQPHEPAPAKTTTMSDVKTPHANRCEGPIGQGGQPGWP
jgi:hypothetical protein